MSQLDKKLIEKAEAALSGNFTKGLIVPPTEVLKAHEVWLKDLSVSTQIKALLMQGLSVNNIKSWLGEDTFESDECQYLVGLDAYRKKEFETAIACLEPLALKGHKKAATYLLLAAICMGDKKPDLLQRCVEDAQRREPEPTKQRVRPQWPSPQY